MSDNPEIWPNPPGVSVEYLLDLVTWEHNQRPRYMATVALSVDPYIDGQNIALGYQTLYNIDTAVGEQLDFIGQWVGITRYITEPINVFFSFDDIDEDVGFDEGKWQSEFEFTSLSHVIKLDDEQYRLLLKARIVSNHWDGTVEGAYRAWDTLFAGTGYSVLIQDGLPAAEHYFTFDDPEKGLFGFDMVPFWSGRQFRYPHYNGNMNIIIALMSDKPVDAIMRTLFREGYMGLDFGRCRHQPPDPEQRRYRQAAVRLRRRSRDTVGHLQQAGAGAQSGVHLCQLWDHTAAGSGREHLPADRTGRVRPRRVGQNT